jgi:hypothetical protein
LAGFDFRYLTTRLANGGVIDGALWYQQSDTDGVNDNDTAFGVSLRMPNSEGFRAGIAYKELEENFYPALGFVNRVGVSDLTAEVGYTWYPSRELFRTVFSGIDYERIDTLDGHLQSEAITFRALEIENNSGDAVALHYQLFDEYVDAPFNIWEDPFDETKFVEIPVGNYSFEQYCISYDTGEHRKLSAEGYYCGGGFYDGDISAPGINLTWRPNEHFKFVFGYHLSDIELPQGKFDTHLSSVRADIAFTNTWFWENFLQYDNVSYALGVNSILRWMPRAGREVIFVVNREFLDYTRDQTFTSVTGDITFKFSYTFRF